MPFVYKTRSYLSSSIHLGEPANTDIPVNNFHYLQVNKPQPGQVER